MDAFYSGASSGFGRKLNSDLISSLGFCYKMFSQTAQGLEFDQVMWVPWNSSLEVFIQWELVSTQSSQRSFLPWFLFVGRTVVGIYQLCSTT